MESKKEPKGMTVKQEAMARYFVLHWKANGYWPTIKECAEDFKVKVGTIQSVFRALEKKDILHRIPGKARAMKIGAGYDN